MHKNTYIKLSIISVILFFLVALIFAIYKREKTIPETVVIDSEQGVEENYDSEMVGTAENAPNESIFAIPEQSSEKDSENEETEQDEKLIIQQEEIKEITNDTNISDKEEDGLEQPEYIGRQIENYVEPNAEEIWNGLYEHHLAYKDTYQSNIVIVRDDLGALDIDSCEWYIYEPKPAGSYYEINQWVCYAITTYYDGNIPCDYFVTLDDDIHNYDPAISTMIFEVQTYGDKPLNICIDMYNYKIRVEEGIKKED